MSNVINGSAEELPSGGSLHPLQRAFIEDAGLQSGYCAPGQICSAVGMAAEVRRGVPSHVTADRSAEPIELGRDELRERMSGNLCRDFFGEKALFPLLACWVTSGPIVATVHTAMRKSRWLLALQPVLRSALEKIDGRIAVSEAARTTFVQQLSGDAVLIPNGLATRRYRHAEPLDGWPGTGGSIGFLGRMDESRKGLPVLLQASELLAPGRPGLRLLIGGNGDAKEHRDNLPAELCSRAVFLGEVSEEDKIRLLHSVDVFCSPNTGGESFGIVTVEVMVAGRPIVASDIPAFRDVLRDGQAGELFTPGDPASLASAAVRLLDDPARRAALSVAALDAVAAYDWGIVARDVVSVYETVVLGRTPESIPA